MQTRNRKFKLPPGLEKHTREEIAAAKNAKDAAVVEEKQRKEEEKAERQAKQTASKKRIAQFEDQLVAQQKTKQTLRPDQLLISDTSSPATTAANIARPTIPVNSDSFSLPDADGPTTVEDSSAKNREDISSGAWGDEAEENMDLGLLPNDDVDGPPTSESEAGFGFGMGNRSTDDISVYADGPTTEGDNDEEGDIDDAILDVDMPGSSDEYVRASDGDEEEDEEEEDDYEQPSTGAKRKNGSARPCNVQHTKKKSRQSSSGLDLDDPTVQEFLAYQKEKEKQKKKALQSQARAATRKVEKSAIRSSTQAMRTTAPSKPKLAPAPKKNTTSANQSKVKKSSEIGGLKKNWRSKIYTMPGAAASSTVSLAKSTTSGGEEELGEFDHDESKTAQAAARLAQVGGRSKGMRVKEEDDVKLVPADVAEIDSKERGSGRKNYAKRDLPLTSASQLVNWDKDIVPSIIIWVGTLPDTFGANAHPELRDKVSNRWCSIFPKLSSVVEHNGRMIKRHEHPAIFSVIFQAIRTWRSEIGKLAVEYMATLWEYELMAVKWNTIELRREYIAMYLDKNAFAYEDFSPQDGTRSGAFRGALLLQSFTYHVRHLVRIVGRNLADRLEYFEEHGYPIGAMALCFVAVKRSLKQWEKGYLVDEADPSNSKKRAGVKSTAKPKTSASGFNNDPWGVEARVKVIPLVKQLKPHQWADIFTRCESMLASDGQLDDDEPAEDIGEGPDGGGAGADDEPEMIISD